METLELVLLKEKTTALTFKLTDNFDKDDFSLDVTMRDIARYFKGIYSNYERFRSRYVEEKFDPFFEDPDCTMEEKFAAMRFVNLLCEEFQKPETTPFSYSEVFQIKAEEFQAIVWESVDIGEMVKNLDGVRTHTAGKKVKHKQFDKQGNFLGIKEYENIYEIYECNGGKLNDSLRNQKIHAVKCWCTSTDKEHFIWIDSKYKDDPLEAIASTFRVHKNLVPYIKELKRQGDILLVEYTQEGIDKNIMPEGEMVSLTQEQYFNLLTAQS